MATIKDVRVWARNNEVRIYVHTEDGREGVKYLSDTRWHKRGEIGGDLTADEWKEAKAIATRDNKWFTYVAALNSPQPTKAAPAGDLTANGFPKAKRGDYCPRCGHFAEAGNDLVLDYDAVEDRNVYHVYHTDRSICEANVATANAERAQREAFQTHERRFRDLFRDAEYPAASVNIADLGEVLLDTMNLYGGGYRITADEQYVWFIDNNGADGDDWSRNNVETWGAGAIGRRLPRTEELVADARALVAEHGEIKETR